MNTITIFNNKGGVGKTTLLCNLAAYFSIKLKKKILIIDADPQCNATTYLLGEEKIIEIYDKRSIVATIDYFIEPLRKGLGYAPKNLTPTQSDRFKVDLIPGDPRLSLSEDLLATDWKDANSGDPRGLRTSFVFADIYRRFIKYDYIFIDVGPSLGAINRSVLIGSDFFLMPMSSDIFSLMAIKNISESLKKWRKDLKEGLRKHDENENEHFKIDNTSMQWNLKFAGYVYQQYTAKTVRGKRQPVKAYDRIIKKAPELIQNQIVREFSNLLNSSANHKLGEIPNLHSIVPLSQTANAPIFDLKAKDGVVGAHFSKVDDSEKIFDGIAENLIKNIKISKQ